MLDFKGIWRKLIVLACLTLILPGCLSDSSSLEIPAGDQIQFVNKDFIKYSDNHYSMLLRQVLADGITLETLPLDPTPDYTVALDENMVHTVIVPKGVKLNGVYVLQVLMPNQDLDHLSAIVLPGEIIVPSIQTSLVFDVLSTYQPKKVYEQEADRIKALQMYVEDFSRTLMNKFKVPATVSPAILYRFLRNGLGTDGTFLGMLDKMGVKFDYALTSALDPSDPTHQFYRVVQAPYPFGQANIAPKLAAAPFTTPLGDQHIHENVKLSLKATVNDDDLLFYAWYYNGDSKPYPTPTVNEFTKTWDFKGHETQGGSYSVKMIASDGGEQAEADWTVFVENTNQPPKILVDCGAAGYRIEQALAGTTQTPWECIATGADDDGDPLSFKIDGQWPLTSPKVMVESTPGNGDWHVMAPDSQGYVHANRVKLSWAPINRDFSKKQIPVRITVFDVPNDGVDYFDMTLLMVPKNRRPSVVMFPDGKYYKQSNFASVGAPRIFDQCLQKDQDLDDLGLEFVFEIWVRDADQFPFPANVLNSDYVTLNFEPASLLVTPPANPSGPLIDLPDNHPTGTGYFGASAPVLEDTFDGGPPVPVRKFTYWWRPSPSQSKLAFSVTPDDEHTEWVNLDPATMTAHPTITTPLTYSIVIDSDPRSHYPCFQTGDVKDTHVLPGQVLAKSYSMMDYDNDGTHPLLVMMPNYANVGSNEVSFRQSLPFIYNSTKNESLVYKNSIFGAQSYGTTGTGWYSVTGDEPVSGVTANLNMTYVSASRNAGMVDFKRKVPVTNGAAFNSSYAALNNSATLGRLKIPKGTLVRTTYSGASPYMPYVQFATALDVYLEPYENEALIPVDPVASTFKQNDLSIIDPLPIDTATSASVTTVAITSTAGGLDYSKNRSLSVVFVQSGAAKNILIKAGTTVSKAECAGGATSCATPARSATYIVTRDLIFNTTNSPATTILRDADLSGAEATLSRRKMITYTDVSVWSELHIHSAISPGSISMDPTSDATVVANLDATNLDEVFPYVGYSPEYFKNFGGSWLGSFGVGMIAKTFDGKTVLAGELTGTLYGMDYTNSTSFSNPTIGVVRFTNSSGSDVNLSATDQIRTKADRMLFRPVAAFVVAAHSSLDVPVIRYFPILPVGGTAISRPYTIWWDAVNRAPLFLSSVQSAQNWGYVAGGTVGHMLEVSDSTNAYETLDSMDRYTYTIASVTPAPQNGASSYQLCRLDPTVAGNACTPCGPQPDFAAGFCALETGTFTPVVSARASIGHHESRLCYIKFVPGPNDMAQTYKFTVTATDSGDACAAGSQGRAAQTIQSTPPKSIDIQVVEPNFAPYLTDKNCMLLPLPSIGNCIAVPPGTATSTANTIGTFIEGPNAAVSLFSYDDNISADYKSAKFTFDMPAPNAGKMYDIKNGTYIALPAKLKAQITNINELNQNVRGGKGTATILWNPTDAEAKLYSTTQGYIVGVKIEDAQSSVASIRLSQFAYFMMKVVNKNNSPTIGAIGTTSNKFTVIADKYFRQDFLVADEDSYSDLSVCRQSDGVTPLAADTTTGNYDPAPTNVNYCHLREDDFRKNADPNYAFPMDASCMKSGAPNPDLAIPKLTRSGGSYIDPADGKVKQKFTLEWCPQQGQVGSYDAVIKATDSGDQGACGTAACKEPALTGTAPLSFKVVMPVRFVSPHVAANGVPDHAMKQTSGGNAARPFIYKTIINNSYGNPVSYSITEAPRPCTISAGVQTGGVCIDSKGVITWMTLATDITIKNGVDTPAKIAIKVTDTVRNESSTAFFYLTVQDPTVAPYEISPTITSRSPLPLPSPMPSPAPAPTKLAVDEKQVVTFTVTAADKNNDGVYGSNPNSADVLWYRWYVNGVLMYDTDHVENDGTVKFVWTPGNDAGTVDPDGPTGPLGIGENLITVEVTDGNVALNADQTAAATTSWTAVVRNTNPLPNLLVTGVTARNLQSPTTTAFTWLQEAGVHATSGASSLDWLFLSGTYTSSGSAKNYIWALQFKDGVYQVTAPLNIYDGLNWKEAGGTKRIAAKLVSSVPTVYLTGNSARSGPWTSVQYADFYSMNSTLASVKTTDTAPSLSSGTNLYLDNSNATGIGVTANYNTVHSFYVSTTGDLFWDRSLSSGVLVHTHTITNAVDSTVAAGDSKNVQFTSLAVDKTNKLLYASVTDGATYNKLFVFDISGTVGAALTPPAIQNRFNLSGADPANPTSPSLPADIAIDSKRGRAFVFLKGVGTFAKYAPGDTAPAVGNLGYILPSASDVVSGTTKLLYDPANDLLYGVSRKGAQVYSVDPTSFNIKTSSVQGAIDNMILIPESRTLWLIDRTSGTLFKAN